MVVREVSKVRERVALIAWFMTSLTSPRFDLEGLADAVEDDDGVVDRVTGDGEDGADVDERELAAECRTTRPMVMTTSWTRATKAPRAKENSKRMVM